MRRAVGICLLGAMVLTVGAPRHALAQEKAAAAPTPDPQDLAVLLSAVDATQNGTAASGVPIGWQGQHFFRSQGDTIYIPFTIGVDRAPFSSPAASVYVRAVSRTAAVGSTKYAWEAAHAVDLPGDGAVARAMALLPGAYEVFVAVKEARVSGAAPKVGVLRHELTVPSLSASELSTSSVVLARALEQLPAPLPPEQQQDNPYVFGPLKVTPSPDGRFPKSGELHLFFIVYGAAESGGKPDVQVDLNFHQRLPDGEKYFNRTLPQELNTRTLAPEFNLALGHQLISRFSVPLATFQPGDYRLEIKVTDKLSGRSLTNNVNFAVSAS
jgi:hypothetical protein